MVKERLNSSRSRCFVKARFNCLPTGNFLAEVVTWGSLAWAIICSLWVFAFSFDLAHLCDAKFKTNSLFQTMFA